LRCSLPLRFAQPGRNRADSMPASRELRAIQFGCPPGSPTLAAWLTAPAPQETRPARPALPNRRKWAARSRQDRLEIERRRPHIPANRGQPNRASSPRARRKHVAASPTLVQCGLSPEGIAKFPRTAFHEGTFSRHRTARADRRPAFSELRVMCSEAPPPFPHRHF